jgi:hypothetical protein
MIKRSLLCTLVLVVLYSLYIGFFKPGHVVQYTLQNNLIRAQNYIYSDSVKGSDLVIGTSMSAKINQDKLPKNVYLLAGAGFSVYDGMSLVLNAKTHPKYVFIEENSILLPERPDYIKYLFNVPDYYRKKYMVSMRDGFQPAGEFYNAVSIHTAPRIAVFTRYFFNPMLRIFYKGKQIPVNPDDYYTGEKMRSNSDTNMIKATFVRLREKVNELEKNGAKVCFYRVPNEHDVFYSYVSLKIMSYFPRYFPPSKYTYLPNPNIYEYHMPDQIHMDDTSCTRFTYFMTKNINAVLKNNNLPAH